MHLVTPLRGCGSPLNADAGAPVAPKTLRGAAATGDSHVGAPPPPPPPTRMQPCVVLLGPGKAKPLGACDQPLGAARDLVRAGNAERRQLLKEWTTPRDTERKLGVGADGARTQGLERTPDRDFDPRAATRAAEAVAAAEGSDDDDDDEADDDEAGDEADHMSDGGEDASPSSSNPRWHSRSRARAHAGGLPRLPGHFVRCAATVRRLAGRRPSHEWLRTRSRSRPRSCTRLRSRPRSLLHALALSRLSSCTRSRSRLSSLLNALALAPALLHALAPARLKDTSTEAGNLPQFPRGGGHPAGGCGKR